MADIILPQVDLLTSTDDNTNVLVEQGGQINRVNKSLFGSSDAETIAALEARIATLESAEVPSGITRTLLWSAPSSYENNGASAATLSLNDSLANYDEIVVAWVWTSHEDEGWAYNAEPHFTIDQSSLTDTDVMMSWGNSTDGVRFLNYKTATSLSMSDGYNGDWASNNYCQVPGAIYGIKYN